MSDDFPIIRMHSDDDCVRGSYAGQEVKMTSEQYSALKALYKMGGIGIPYSFKTRTLKGLKNNPLIKKENRKQIVSEFDKLPEHYKSFVKQHPLTIFFYYITDLPVVRKFIKNATSYFVYLKKKEKEKLKMDRERKAFLKKEEKRKAVEFRKGERYKEYVLKREMKRIKHITKIF